MYYWLSKTCKPFHVYSIVLFSFFSNSCLSRLIFVNENLFLSNSSSRFLSLSLLCIPGLFWSPQKKQTFHYSLFSIFRSYFVASDYIYNHVGYVTAELFSIWYIKLIVNTIAASKPVLKVGLWSRRSPPHNAVKRNFPACGSLIKNDRSRDLGSQESHHTFNLSKPM